MDPEDNIRLPIIAVNMITTQVLMSANCQDSFTNKLQHLRESTSQDEQHTRLNGYINTGFSCEKKNLPTDLHEFWPHKEMLSIEPDLITCRTRILVPREMRLEMLQYIHEGHQGKEHCLLRARNAVFWPKIIYDIQQLIVKCMICQEYGKSQPLNYPGATPISMAHTGDRFVLLEKNGLFDSCICLFQVHPSEEIAQFYLCSLVHRIFYDCHRVGFDNSPCYNSKEFQQFLQHYSITHQTSSPNHPRSNGFVERLVGVAKKLMDKVEKKGNCGFQVCLTTGSHPSQAALHHLCN